MERELSRSITCWLTGLTPSPLINGGKKEFAAQDGGRRTWAVLDLRPAVSFIPGWLLLFPHPSPPDTQLQEKRGTFHPKWGNLGAGRCCFNQEARSPLYSLPGAVPVPAVTSPAQAGAMHCPEPRHASQPPATLTRVLLGERSRSLAPSQPPARCSCLPHLERDKPPGAAASSSPGQEALGREVLASGAGRRICPARGQVPANLAREPPALSPTGFAGVAVPRLLLQALLLRQRPGGGRAAGSRHPQK